MGEVVRGTLADAKPGLDVGNREVFLLVEIVDCFHSQSSINKEYGKQKHCAGLRPTQCQNGCSSNPIIVSSDSLLPERAKKDILMLRCGVIPLCGRYERLRRCSGAATPGHCRILLSKWIILYKEPYVKSFFQIFILLVYFFSIKKMLRCFMLLKRKRK